MYTNEEQQRALARHHALRGLPLKRKATHRDPPQTCVLWLPHASGYVGRIEGDRFSIVEHASLGLTLAEEAASAAAAHLMARCKVRVSVRPFFGDRAEAAQ
jgi:hypothetical protein